MRAHTNHAHTQVICFVVIAKPMLCLILSVVVLMIDIDLVGMLWVWGLELNSITTINLVMAVGLVRVFETPP